MLKDVRRRTVVHVNDILKSQSQNSEEIFLAIEKLENEKRLHILVLKYSVCLFYFFCQILIYCLQFYYLASDFIFIPKAILNLQSVFIYIDISLNLIV